MRTTRTLTTRILLAGLLVAGLGLQARSVAGAATEALPGMCNGRSDANLLVVAIASDGTAPVKYQLTVETDASGVPTGTMIVGKGSTRLHVTEWCRVWLHVPGTTGGGSCEHSDVRDDATTAHAVGQGVLANGQEVTVRTDIRETEEGRFFRVRYRVPDDDHDHDALVTEGHDDVCEGGWTRIPVEGWYPLRQMHVGPAG